MIPLKWGIISTATIGVEQVVPAMMQSPMCEIAAIASRDLGKAKEVALSYASGIGGGRGGQRLRAIAHCHGDRDLRWKSKAGL